MRIRVTLEDVYNGKEFEVGNKYYKTRWCTLNKMYALIAEEMEQNHMKTLTTAKGAKEKE
jgi:hypothetical protein